MQGFKDGRFKESEMPYRDKEDDSSRVKEKGCFSQVRKKVFRKEEAGCFVEVRKREIWRGEEDWVRNLE